MISANRMATCVEDVTDRLPVRHLDPHCTVFRGIPWPGSSLGGIIRPGSLGIISAFSSIVKKHPFEMGQI